MAIDKLGCATTKPRHTGTLPRHQTPRYTATLGVIEQEVERHSLAVMVCGYFWGEAEGAWLAAGGAPFPDYDGTGGLEPSEEDKLIALWSLL